MGIVNIDGQPITFDFNPDNCPECDDRNTSAMVQDGDVSCIQWKNEPCSENLLCAIEYQVGGEEINNPSFDSASGWTLGTGWSYGTGEACKTAGNTNTLQQVTGNFLFGQYQIEIHVSITSGSIVFMSGTPRNVTLTNGVNLFPSKFMFDTGVSFTPSSDFEGCIQLVSVKKAGVSDCWNLTQNWSINQDSQLCHASGATNATNIIPVSIAINTWYEVTIVVDSISGGTLTLGIGDADEVITNAGTYTYWLNSGGTNAVTLTPESATIVCVSSLTAAEQFREYVFTIHDCEGGIVGTITTAPDYFENYVTLCLDWANTGLTHNQDEFPLEYGCYKICYTDCGGANPNLVCNWDFATDITFDGQGVECGDTFSDYYRGVRSNNGIATFTDTIPAVGAGFEWKKINPDILFSSGTCIHYKIIVDSASGVVDAGFNLVELPWLSETTFINAGTYEGDILLDGDLSTINFFSSGGTWVVSLIEITLCAPPAPEEVCSNCIDYKATHPCTKWISGFNTNRAFGFLNNFSIGQRLKVKKFNPFYPESRNSYTYSNGRTELSYADSTKKYIFGTDLIGEVEHNSLRLQKACRTFTIDGTEYVADAEDYNPEWLADGSSNLASVKFIISTVPSVKFNPNG